jgi:ferredoxin
MLRKIRIILALVFFIGITMLFLDFTGTLRHWLGWMAKVQFLPAILAVNAAVVIILVVLTVVFGRIYCSIICPLGVFQDVIAWMGKHGKRNPYSYSKAKNILRYVVLAIFVVALLAGVSSVVALLAPYSSYGRIAGNLFQPIYEYGNNLLAAIAAHIDSYAFYSTDVWIRSIPTFVVAALTFVIVAVLAWRNGRTYCNTICPVGTILSFFARFSWFKITIDTDKCRNCGTCGRYCKAACIDFKHHHVDYSRCVVCGDCLGKCEFGALHYVHPKKKTEAVTSSPTEVQEKEEADTSRRSFLLAAALATTAAAMAQKDKKVDGGLAVIEDKVTPKRATPLTPPGSYSAENMAKHCTACQLCVSECPNGVLRPSTDLGKFMQPTMSYERGYCRPECTRCSSVCPTGAIRKIDKAEKSSIQIGHAVWVKKNCVAINDGVDCGNCARHCPSGAITMVPYQVNGGEVMVPAVNTERCIGCGACENLCPARPFTAIYVEGHEMHRTI